MRRFSGAVAAAALGFGLLAAPAHGQLGTTFYSTGEFDTNDVVLALAGVSISPLRAGWTPVLNVQGYWLRYPLATVDQDLLAVTPSIGLKNTFSGGSFEARGGYTFQDADTEILPSGVLVADTEDGFTTAAHLEYWGEGLLGAQAIANYNWGAETLWTRGRLTHRIFGMGDGHVRAGAEAAYLYNQNYDAVQVGGLVGVVPGRHVALNIGAGRKIDGDDGATYFKAELVVMP